jgi:hypothetical protein
MRVLYPINFIASVGADRWMGNGYKDAFEDLGHEVFWIQSSDPIESRIKETVPDIVFLAYERLKLSDAPVLENFRKRGGKVAVFVNSEFNEDSECFRVLKEHDVADLYRGETEPEWMKEFEEKTGKSYFLTPNAAHERLHFPVAPVKKYQADIVFLGANLPLKKELFEKLLFPLQKKYNVKLYGPGWTAKDDILRTAAYAARKAGLAGLNDRLSRLRITVPPQEENQLYSSAKICINLHEARTGAGKNRVILNERTFKIPACGGFEICDFITPESVLRKYFNEDEMVYARDAEDWFRKIDHYMGHDDERERIRKKGAERALREHLYTNRIRLILEKLGY